MAVGTYPYISTINMCTHYTLICVYIGFNKLENSHVLQKRMAIKNELASNQLRFCVVSQWNFIHFTVHNCYARANHMRFE